MKEIIYNYDNLTESDVTEVVTRIKVLLINDNYIYLGYANNIYQFPGGHLEENETFNECIIREIKEETGITLGHNDITKPFFKLSHINKDFPKKDINRKSEVYYYVIYTNKKPDISQISLTEAEMLANFEIRNIPLDNVIDELKINICKNEKNKIIAVEMIEALNEYFKTK